MPCGCQCELGSDGLFKKKAVKKKVVQEIEN